MIYQQFDPSSAIFRTSPMMSGSRPWKPKRRSKVARYLHNRNHPRAQIRIRIGTMRSAVKSVILLLACGISCLSWTQDSRAGWAFSGPNASSESTVILVSRARKVTLDADDRLSLITAALDSKHLRYSEHDCSHLVNAI